MFVCGVGSWGLAGHAGHYMILFNLLRPGKLICISASETVTGGAPLQIAEMSSRHLSHCSSCKALGFSLWVLIPLAVLTRAPFSAKATLFVFLPFAAPHSH